MIKKFVVVEIAERSFLSATICYTEEEAIRKANDLLREQARLINAEEDLETGEGKDTLWSFATKGNCNAWSNYRMHWDAYVIEI